MSKVNQSRVVGLLGVGFDHQDRQVRITQAENYQILMGSDSLHQALQKLCLKIDETIKTSGRSMSDYTPESFMKLMQEIN